MNCQLVNSILVLPYLCARTHTHTPLATLHMLSYHPLHIHTQHKHIACAQLKATLAWRGHLQHHHIGDQHMQPGRTHIRNYHHKLPGTAPHSNTMPAIASWCTNLHKTMLNIIECDDKFVIKMAVSFAGCCRVSELEHCGNS